MNARGGAGDAWPEDVRLDRVAAERDNQGQERNQRPLEDEGDHHRKTHPDRRADQRKELEEEGQDSEHDRVRDTDQCHRDPGVCPHDQRHGQLTPGVLTEGRANGEEREVIDLFAPRKEFAHGGDQLAAFHQQVDRDHDHQQNIDQRPQRPTQDAEDRSEHGRADPGGPARQTQLERNARIVDRVLQGADESDGTRFQCRQLLGLADQRRRHERDHPSDQPDDDDVNQKHRDRPPAFEHRQRLHPVDHRREQQGDDRGEDKQQKNVEEMDDQILALVKEHDQRERDQDIHEDPDRALEVAPCSGHDPFVVRHGASLADRPLETERRRRYMAQGPTATGWVRPCAWSISGCTSASVSA